MPTTTDTTYIKCLQCSGTGRLNPGLGGGEGAICNNCSGTGFEVLGKVEDVEDFTAITDKIDAIKTMLDSQTIGLQKMSSNLDDMMVKLDV